MTQIDATLPVCNSLWIGGDLGPMSGACLTSFVRRGHRVVLYCYDVPNDVPSGVDIADAAAVLPSTRIVRHKATGSYSLFSNLFRYELIRQGRGIWIDCDVYCLRAIRPKSAYVYGWQWRNSINGAVLGLPSDAPVLDRLSAIFDAPSPILPWLPDDARAHFLARKLAGESFALGDLPWGSAGPRALSYLLTEAGIANHAQPKEVFYPLTHDEGAFLLRGDFDVVRMISPQTLTVHLWNQTMAKHLKQRQRGSAMDHLVRHGTLFDETRVGIV